MQLLKNVAYSISKNSISEIIGTFKLSALVRLLGPILLPATTKDVLADIELTTFPPLESIKTLSLEDLIDTYPKTLKGETSGRYIVDLNK